MKYFFKTRLGNTRYQMADGSLLCKNVPIARTGTQVYSALDLPNLKPDSQGQILVERHSDEVFRPETLASFEGMSVTLSHPEDAEGNVIFVDTDNWRDLAQGHVQNVRRGESEQADLIIADLIIKDALAIEEINHGNDEVSCGYDAQYEQLAPGIARQYEIVGNHVALVPKGRAGIRCAIGDSMSNKTQTWFKRLLSAHRTKDAVAMESVLNNPPESLTGDEGTGELPKAININISPQHPMPAEKPEELTRDEAVPDYIQAILTRLDAFEGKTADSGDKPEDKTVGTVDDEEKNEKAETITGDAAYKAELIMPGVALSTPVKPTAFKRQVLANADQTLVRAIVGDAEINRLPKRTVDMAFNAVAELSKNRNIANTPTIDSIRKSGNAIADLNKSNAEFWATRGKNL
ncbi:DUF2213 domain-containing protein [Arsenophonus nasoniae]|uniref:DUF2213 domain-containing protein n=1 Tax=Arsenophonus nasoniae TaxID=638 RepID=UPI0038799B75